MSSLMLSASIGQIRLVGSRRGCDAWSWTDIERSSASLSAAAMPSRVLAARQHRFAAAGGHEAEGPHMGEGVRWRSCEVEILPLSGDQAD